YITSPFMFLTILDLFLLIVGCLIDIFSAIIVLVPMIVPIATGYHISPYHLAIVFLANMEIGYLTPPFGLNLFLASYRFKKPIAQIFMDSLPFIIILLIALAVLTYVPIVSTFLVERIY